MSNARTSWDPLRKPIPTDLLLCQTSQFMQYVGCPLTREEKFPMKKNFQTSASAYESVRLRECVNTEWLGGENGNREKCPEVELSAGVSVSGELTVCILKTFMKPVDTATSRRAVAIRELKHDVFDSRTPTGSDHFGIIHQSQWTRRMESLFSRPWLQCQTRQRMCIDYNAEVVTPAGWRPWIKNACA